MTPRNHASETVIAHWQRQMAIDFIRRTTLLKCDVCGAKWVVFTSDWWCDTHSGCPTCYPNPKRRQLENEEHERDRVDVTDRVRQKREADE